MVVIDVLDLAALPTAADPRWSAWLTQAELHSCRGLQRASEHLGARLAGKRAVAVLLGVDWPPPCQAIEISRGQHRAPQVELRGDLASRRLARPWVSLTHAGGYVAALSWLPPAGEKS